MKLTKKQIKEGLKNIPLEDLIGRDISLTAKQKAFAEEVARGSNKTEAYRKAYNTNGNPNTQASEAHKVANNPKVAMMITKVKAGIEAQKYLLPPHLRTLAIENITNIAIDEDNSPRDRLKALELIGKFAEVSLFEDRKETTIVSNSEEMKAKLLDALKTAIGTSNSLSEHKKRSADDLLRDIKGDVIQEAQLIEDSPSPLHNNEPSFPQDDETILAGEGGQIDNTENPPTATPLNEPYAHDQALHSIPHTQSPTLDTGTPIDFVDIGDLEPMEKTPLSDSGSPDNGIGNPDWKEE